MHMYTDFSIHLFKHMLVSPVSFVGKINAISLLYSNCLLNKPPAFLIYHPTLLQSLHHKECRGHNIQWVKAEVLDKKY